MSTYTPDPDSEPGGRRPGAPRMPRADSTAAGFIRAMFSAAWWRELAGHLAGLFHRRRSEDWPGPYRTRGLPDLLDLDEPQDTFTLETPAKGEAYNFLVGIRCSWTVQGTAFPEQKKRRTQEVQRLITQQRPVIRERIEDTIRPIARDYPPYRAAEAERAIRHGLRECVAEGDLEVKVRARVDVCEPVRQDLRQVWQQRLVEDSKGDLKKASVELIGELQESWRELLLRGLRGIGEVQVAKAGWIAPYALALAQDPEQSAGAYLQDMIKHRVSHAEDLLTDLSDLVVDQRVDAIEFAFASDSALRAVLSYLGVPVPPRNSANGDGNPPGDTDA